MDDATYQATRLNKPFKFFGHEFTKERIYSMDYDEADQWLRMARQSLDENISYREACEARGNPIVGEELAKKISFDAVLKKFIYFLDDRQHRIGESRRKLFMEIAEEYLDPKDYDRIMDQVDDELAEVAYDSPDQMSLLS